MISSMLTFVYDLVEPLFTKTEDFPDLPIILLILKYD